MKIKRVLVDTFGGETVFIKGNKAMEGGITMPQLRGFVACICTTFINSNRVDRSYVVLASLQYA